jgi:hypothetical protein
MLAMNLLAWSAIRDLKLMLLVEAFGLLLLQAFFKLVSNERAMRCALWQRFIVDSRMNS